VAVELRIVSVVQPNAGANDSLGLKLPLTVPGTAPPTDSGASGATATTSEAP
jgi:type VI secretion system protein ImpL